MTLEMALDEAREEGLQEGREEGLQEGREEGLQLGEQRGVERMAKLIAVLNGKGEIELMTKALQDQQIRNQLFEKYNL